MLSRTNHLTFSLALLAVLGCESQSTGAGDVLVVAEVEISPPGLSLVAGATGVLVATPKTSSGIVVPNRRATWSSDDLGIATVSEDGVVTGVSTGSTGIHATIEDVQGTVTVEVSPQGVASVTLHPPQLTLMVGETGDLVATPRDADGAPIPGRQVTFSSDNPLIATVSGTGHVTAVATGLTVITATVEGKSGTANVSVTSLPATQLEFQNQPATGAAGTPIPAVRIEVQNDQGGMVTEGSVPVTMALADNPTGAVLSGTLTVGAVNGVATFNDLRVNQAGVGYSLRASSGSLEPALSAAFTVVAGSASRLAIATQPSSSAKSGAPLAVQPTIQIRDAGGNAVAAAGVEITAVLEGSGATLGGTRTATTNPQGLAAFTDLVVSGTAGPYTLLFAAPGLPAVASNSVVLHAGAPASLTIEQQPAATTESGVTLVRQPVVQLLDQAGNVVAEPGFAVTAAIQSGGGVLNGSLTVLTGTDGRASFTNLSIGGLIGTRVLRFTSGLLPPVTSGPIVVVPGPAASLVITTQPPASSASGAALSPAPVIRLTDAFDNAVDPVQEISITVTIATGTAGSLSGTTSVTTSAGVATFSGLILTGPAGPFTLRFSNGTLPPAVSQTVTIGVGPPASLAIVTQPSSTVESGTALGRQPVIQLHDASGAPTSVSGVEVTVAIASGGGTLGGTTTKTTDANGRATFTDLVITGTAGQRTLRFSGTGLVGVTSDAIDVTAPPPSALQITTQPSTSARSGEALVTQPVLRLENSAGDPVAGATVTATINSGPVGGTLANASAVTDANGAATFAGLAITGEPGPYVLRFASGALSVLSVTVTIDPVPAKLVLTTAPSGTTTSGAALSTQPSVQIADATGAPVAQGGTPISAEIESGPAGARVDNALATTNASGLATFSGLAITGPVGTYVLRFVAGSLTAVSSGSIVLSAGTPATITIPVEPPASAVNGVALSGSTVLRVQDGSGTNASGVTVTASLASGAGQLSGTLSRATGADGRATFDDLVLTGETGPYTLRFSIPGGASVVSRAITLAAGAAASLSIATQPATTAVSGVPLSRQPVVQLRDESGNAVAQSGIAINATIASGGGTLGGTTTRTTGANGQASFTDLEITGSPGPRTLQFSGAGLTGVTSGTITLGVGNAATITIPVQPPATAVNDVAFSGDAVVQVRDAGGNNLAGVAITAGVASGGGALQGTLTRTTGFDGRATFDDLKLVGTAGTYTLRFTAPGGLSTVSRAITLAAGAEESLSITTQPATAAVSGVPLSRQPVVQLRDGSGNAVARSGIAITTTIASGGGTLGGTATRTTDANGQASFTNLVITGSPGPRTLQFSGAGLTSVTSGTITLGVGSASVITIPVQPPSTAVNDVLFSTDPVVQVEDAAGNNLAGVAVTAGVASGNGELQGTLTGTTGSNGRVTFNDLKLVGATGTYTLRFTAAGGLSVVSRAITLTAGAEESLSITTQPAITAVSGVPLSRQPVVQLRDGSGNAVARSGIAITATIASGGGTLGGTATRTTDANGQASFTNLVITGSPGPRTLQFSGAGLTSVTSGTITLGVGSASVITIPVQPPTTAVNDVLFSTDPVVQVEDAAGNNLAGVAVTAGVASGNGELQGTLTGTTGSNGRVTFNDLKLVGATGTYTLRFTAAGGLSVVSRAITLAAGEGTQLAITTQPSASTESGAVLARQPVIQVRDLSDNASAQGGVAVTVSIASGGGTLGGTTTRTTGANGQASFTDLEINGTPGPRTLRFSATSLTGVTSATVNVTAPPATRLLLATPPSSNATNGAALSTQPSLQIADANGGAVAQAGTTVTAVIASGPGGASLSNATAVTNATGRATFSGLAINGLVGTYTLRFQAAALTPVTSGNITLGAGAPESISIVTQPPTTAVSGTQLSGNTVVVVRDGSGNNASGASVSASVASGNGQLQGTVTRTTASNGQATFDNLALVGPTGTYTLRFSVAGISVVSRAISLENMEGQILFILTQPPSNAERNRAFNQDPRLEIRDANGNRVTLDAVAVTAELVTVSGSGSLGGDVVRETSNGVVTFPNLKINMAGTYRIRFTTPGRASATSNTIEVRDR